MVGLQVAREAARELHPERIVIASLRDEEVREAIEFLKSEIEGVELVGASGDIFIPQSLQGRRRADIVGDEVAYDELFHEIFARDADYSKSALHRLMEEHRPDVIVDCINTATAIRTSSKSPRKRTRCCAPSNAPTMKESSRSSRSCSTPCASCSSRRAFRRSRGTSSSCIAPSSRATRAST
jgi:hypothetical protein